MFSDISEKIFELGKMPLDFALPFFSPLLSLGGALSVKSTVNVHRLRPVSPCRLNASFPLFLVLGPASSPSCFHLPSRNSVVLLS